MLKGFGRWRTGCEVTGAVPDEPLSPSTVARATAVLIALRIGYAYSWFDIGPGLLAIGAEFRVGSAAWGSLVAAFLVGAGLLQVPAGLLARRHGARSVALVGAGLLAASGLASALAPTFAVLFATRLVAGMGAALFFSPAIGLVGSLYPSGRRGLPVGTFSSAFSAGAGLGLIGGSLLVPAVGWRASMAVGGAMLGVLVLLAVVAIPARAGAPAVPRSVRAGRRLSALVHRGPWVVGLAFVGLEGAAFATGQFVVPFGATVRGWSIALAGAVGMAFVVPSLLGGPVGGTVAERDREHPRRQFLGATVLGAAALAFLPLAGIAGAVAIGVVFSLSYGFVYAVMYVLPHAWPGVPPDEVPLAIGLLNSIQLAGGAGVAYLFGWVVAASSYALAWEVLAAVVVVSLVALIALPASVGSGGGRPRGAFSGPA